MVAVEPHRPGAVRRGLVRALLVLVAAAPWIAAPVSVARAQSPAVDEYVALGLRNAYSQRQQAIDIARARAMRREVFALSLPSVSASVVRTNASGNVIDVGRFVNPAYGALNQLLGTPTFPTDLKLTLPLRAQSYLRLTQPVFAPSAWYGAAAAARAEDAQRFASEGASRQLAAEIRLAWITWYKASSVLGVYDAAVTLLDEQVRSSERLVEEGVRAPDAVLRARADLSAVKQDRLQAAQQGDAARRRLNHLVARPLETPVAASAELAPAPIPSLESALASARAGRDELLQLDASGRAVDAQRRAAQSGYLPTLAVAFDYGYQGADASFSSRNEYRLLTVIAQWDLFNGTASRTQVERATLERRGVATRREEVASLIELQVRTAHDAAVVARAAIDAADVQLAAVERAFQLVRRRYEEGLAVPLELLDARRAFTGEAINRAITLADYQARRVELLRAAALDSGTTP